MFYEVVFEVQFLAISFYNGLVTEVPLFNIPSHILEVNILIIPPFVLNYFQFPIFTVVN